MNIKEVSETCTVTIEDGIERHHTKVISKQTWTTGHYAGKSYRITDHYVSSAAGYRHIMLRRSSEPWSEQ